VLEHDEMSNWIESGGHEPRQFSGAYADQNSPIHREGRCKISLRLASAVLLVMLAAPASQARDPDGRYAAQNPELHKWFESLRSGKGPCCSDADGTAVSDVDWETANGHYRVRLDGEWIDVPDEAVITEPSRIGRTIVWPIRGYLGVSIRCFMPGSMT
jgi:hypothetical protein